MKQIQVTPDNVLRLNFDGVLTKESIQQARTRIENKIAEGSPFGLVIDMTGFEDMTAGAVKEDIKLEASLVSKLKHLPKVAFITEKQWMRSLVNGFGKLVPKVDARSFEADEIDAAIAFASDIPQSATKSFDEASVDRIYSDDPDILAFEIRGKIGKEELHAWSDQFLPQLKQSDDVRLLIRIDEFDGYDMNLFTDKATLELKKAGLKSVSRYAIVGAKPWMRGIATTMNPFFKMDLKTFDIHEESDAIAWLKQ